MWNQPRRHVNAAAKPRETLRRDTPMRRSGDGVFWYDDSGLIFEGEPREREADFSAESQRGCCCCCCCTTLPHAEPHRLLHPSSCPPSLQRHSLSLCTSTWRALRLCLPSSLMSYFCLRGFLPFRIFHTSLSVFFFGACVYCFFCCFFASSLFNSSPPPPPPSSLPPPAILPPFTVNFN